MTKTHLITHSKLPRFSHSFIFNGKFYEQCDDVAIGSPLARTLINVYIVTLKTFGRKTLQVISNEYTIDILLTIYFYYFHQRMTLWNIEIISINKIKT